jgi:hypothetical protein
MVDFRQWYFHMQSTREGEARADERYDRNRAEQLRQQANNPRTTPAQRHKLIMESNMYEHEANIDDYWANRRDKAARNNKPL